MKVGRFLRHSVYCCTRNVLCRRPYSIPQDFKRGSSASAEPVVWAIVVKGVKTDYDAGTSLILLAATLRWFTAGGAIRIAVRQLSQTWKLYIIMAS